MTKKEVNMKKLTMILVLASLTGCIKTINTPSTTDGSSRTNGTYTVVVGVENGYAGECIGSLKDCSSMTSLLKDYSTTLVSLSDKTATRTAVVNALSKGVNAPLLIFYYSGHGGSAVSYMDNTEADGMDEYLCCFDGPLMDNDIWKIISKSKGRVFLIFDCCHSGTMWKQPMKLGGKSPLLSATTHASGSLNMLCWSGCPDSDYSYGDDRGGELTKAILRHLKKAKTYNQLWNLIEADKDLQEFEKVQRTIMGADFGDQKVFQ